MRVLHVITKLELGGAQQTTLASVQHIQDQGFESHLACGLGGMLDEIAMETLGDKLHPMSHLLRPIRPLADWRGLKELRRLMARLNPDIVHTHSSKAGILGRWAAHLEGVPAVLHTVHGFGFHPYQGALTRFLYQRAEKWAGGMTDGLVLVAEADRQVALELDLVPEKQMHLIRSAAPLEQFLFDPSARQRVRNELGLKDEPLVVTVACMKPQKDPLTWLAAALETAAENPRVHFALAGDGILHRDMMARLENHPHRDRIHLLGWRNDISDLLSGADLFFLASLWEGLPKAILQALSSGLPVVATDIPGNAETAALGPVTLVPPQNPEAQSKALLAVLEGSLPAPETRRSEGEERLADALRNFRQDHMLEQLRQLYRSCLDGKGRGVNS